jgi:DNA-directed RNA polymerase II subunit RPB2
MVKHHKEEKKSLDLLDYHELSTYDPEPFFELIDLYFQQNGQISIRHHIDSFNQFIYETIRTIVLGSQSPNTEDEGVEHLISEKISENKKIRYTLTFKNIGIRPPTFDNDETLMYPHDALQKNLSYVAKYTATITQYQEIIDIETNLSDKRVIGKEDNVPIARIPIMVKSAFCNLIRNPNVNNPSYKNHCKYDPGGYFIINGNEKVVLSVEGMVQRKPLVFTKKDQNALIYYVEVLSRPANQNYGPIQNFRIRIKKDGSMVLAIPYINEVSIFTFMRALGLETDEEIVDAILDRETASIMKYQLMICMNNQVLPSKTREEAIEILMTRMKTNRQYNETDPQIKYQQQKNDLMFKLKTYILPHVVSGTGDPDIDLKHRAYYIGYMINKLLKCYLHDSKEVEENRGCDDRDAMTNKRVEPSGVLLGVLFEQFFRKLITDCGKIFKSKNVDDRKPPNIVPQIRPNAIEGGLRQALATGSFGGPTKKGLSQMLNRLNWLRTSSDMHRVITPTVDASSNKMTSPRHLHVTQYGSLCPLETPEGAKTGLSKNLTLVATITINMSSQINIIRKRLRERKIIARLDLIDKKTYHRHFKVFLNGNIEGITKDIISLHDSLRQARFIGEIMPFVSLVLNFKDRELHINTDNGRLIRPYLVVQNNRLLFKPEMIQDPRIKSWEHFIKSYPGVIEFVDTDEAEHNMMLALFPAYIERSRKIMNGEPITDQQQLNFINRNNRYDENIFVRYTHCEIHPCLILGSISSNIPFPDHNQSPRGIYYFSQGKQAMGIYISDFRFRTDISYIQYHPQLPIIAPRAAKYTGSQIFPSGENCMVAIMSYSGLNQEDSVIVNKTAIDMGFMRAQSLKKYMEKIEKNYASSQTAVFTKPDFNQVSGTKPPAKYNKLNARGFAEIETRIENEDIIIGLIKPKPQVSDGEKPYRDSSVEYKSLIPGAVDDVFVGSNADQYPMIRMRIRAERIPQIGDKFSSRHGQKGTMGWDPNAADLPFSERTGISPDIIINPNCMPKRMTIGQLIEGLYGKYCAIKCVFGEATPFVPVNITKINQGLIDAGYAPWGEEIMYNGMTGQKMKVPIFFTPTYYHRLKQMVGDKIHSRRTGAVQMLTQQPPEGRARNGGLRFGEMEKDTQVGHGTAQMLKERLVEMSDRYPCKICDICGLIARRVPGTDYHMCDGCKNTTKISTVIIPYAFKLLTQELQAMHVDTRIRTEKSLDNF